MIPGGKSYQVALSALKAHVMDSPKTAQHDFELAENDAFKEVYPEDEIAGWDFHWKQALKKNLKKHGLGSLYILYNTGLTVQQERLSTWVS